MNSSTLIQAWQAAAKDLGIEIVTPFVLKLKNGEQVQADVLVKDFGPTLVFTEEAWDAINRLDDKIVVDGFGWSVACDQDLSYDRGQFIEMLMDWGWVGAEERRPEWCK